MEASKILSRAYDEKEIAVSKLNSVLLGRILNELWGDEVKLARRGPSNSKVRKRDVRKRSKMISSVSTELSPLILCLTNLTNCGLVPPRVLTRSPSRFQRSLGRGSNDTELFHSFVVSLGTRRAAWRRSQGCDCVARGLK